MPAIKNLLSHIIDYAGLFPPAGLPLSDVCRNYSTYVDGDDEWMLARIIIPSLKLKQFSATMSEQNIGSAEPWLMSGLLPRVGDESFTQAIAEIREFNSRQNGSAWKAVVDTVEVAASTEQEIQSIADLVPADISVFVELPNSGAQELFEQLSHLSKSSRFNLFAKIRTGGLTNDLIPSVEQVADFILLAKQNGMGFKATAGLHHPFRNEYALTYDKDAPRGTMHGFLNVFVAACLVNHERVDRTLLIELLSCGDPGEFVFDEQAIAWRDHRLDAEMIDRTRGEFAISFGSCSFTEPLDDLKAMKLL